MLRLSLFSFEALKEIRAATGVRYDAVAGGALKVYSDQKSLEEAIAISEKQRPLGLEFRVLDRRGCLDLVPALAPRIETLAGGIHFEAEEGGDCFKFTAALADWCRERGAEFRFDTRIEALEPDGTRITGIRTARGRLDADAYVLALGADSPLLMRPLGVRLPIIPVKGYSITVPKSPFPDAPAIPVLDEMRKFGMMPLPDRLRMSGLAEIAGYDTMAQPRRTRAFIAGFTGLFPQLQKCLEAAGRAAPVLLPASGHAARPPDPRPLALRQPLLQRRPGPPRLDAGARLGEDRRRPDRRPRPRPRHHRASPGRRSIAMRDRDERPNVRQVTRRADAVVGLLHVVVRRREVVRPALLYLRDAVDLPQLRQRPGLDRAGHHADRSHLLLDFQSRTAHSLHDLREVVQPSSSTDTITSISAIAPPRMPVPAPQYSTPARDQ